jgi:hypothetical protein
MTTKSSDIQIREERERNICYKIRQIEKELVDKYPILHRSYRNIICSTVLMCMTGIIYLCSCWYFSLLRHEITWLPMTTIVVCIALSISILHEIEHDIIHNLYFKHSPWIQNAIFALVWLAKFNVNPWWRRKLHLHHHDKSGQKSDVEERLIGLGLSPGPLRVAITMNTSASLFISYLISNDTDVLDLYEMLLLSSPTFVTNVGLNILFVAHMTSILSIPEPYLTWVIGYHAICVLPNFIRQSCLVLMSNTCHYYGDIIESSVYYQNQILDHWSLIGFQFFCCNFGATHVMHHYVPLQTFYTRTLCYTNDLKNTMIENGVRNNDLNVILRSNRYFSTIPPNNTDREHDVPFSKQLFDYHLFACVCFVTGTVMYFIYSILAIFALPLNMYHHYIK